MKTKLFPSITLVLLASALALVASAPAPPKPAVPAAKAVAAVPAPEEHPNITGAIDSLEKAKHLLETAAHDFKGHRVKALDHVNEAIRECREALAAAP